MIFYIWEMKKVNFLDKIQEQYIFIQSGQEILKLFQKIHNNNQNQ